jgi:protein-tyrosine phosphatase
MCKWKFPLAYTPSVLFVCLGNICRSPTAEGVFIQKARLRGFKVKVDSAGTSGYKKGVAPDKRSQAVAEIRHYNLSGLKCRRVADEDYENFDYIIAMDNANVRDLKRKCPENLHHKITLLMSYCDSPFDEVPDPYYGGGKGFELVLELIEQACDGLLLALTNPSKVR